MEFNNKYRIAFAGFLVVSIAAFGMMNGLEIIDDSGGERVLNCWNESEECTYTEINTTVEGCNDWFVDHPIEDLECNRTTEGVDEISLITDPGNHVTGDFTDEEYKEELYSFDINYHEDLEFLPSGKMVMPDQHGLIHIASEENGVETVHNLNEVVDNEAVLESSSVGIKGIAVDPNYEENNRVFIYYSISNSTGGEFEDLIEHSTWHFGIASFKMTEDEIKHEKDIANVTGAYFHSGGGVEIGPDNKLYVSIGNAHQDGWAQSMDKRRGKILRVNLDGTVPEDNPFRGKYIYTLGHRNPQSLAWNPENGNLWSSEHGNVRNDEINLIEAGKNYGWGRTICDEVRDESVELSVTENYTSPVKCFKNWTMGPSRMMFIEDEEHPWYGDLFLAGLRGKHLARYDVENGKILDREIFYINEHAPEKTGVSRRIRDVEYFNGAVWMIGDESGIIKLTPE